MILMRIILLDNWTTISVVISVTDTHCELITAAGESRTKSNCSRIIL